jgi:hypothetical protein
VALLAINTDTAAAHSLTIPRGGARRYTLTAKELLASHIELNGKELSLGDDNTLPKLEDATEFAGQARFEPASITFLTFPKAHNTSCR